MRHQWSAWHRWAVIVATMGVATIGEAQPSAIVRVRNAQSGAPIRAAVVTREGSRPIEVLTDASGLASLPAGSRLTVERLGYATVRVRSAKPRAGDTVDVMLRPVRWHTLTTARRADATCPAARGSGLQLWQQVRAALRASELGRAGLVSRATVYRDWSIFNGQGPRDSTVRQFAEGPLVQYGAAPDSLLSHGFLTEMRGAREYHTPSAAFFLHPGFTRRYCVTVSEPSPTAFAATTPTTYPSLQIVAVPRHAAITRPATRIDIKASFWIDTVAVALEWATFTYLGLDGAAPVASGGATVYAQFSDGIAFPVSWSQGTPVAVPMPRFSARDLVYDSSFRVATLTSVLLVRNRLRDAVWPDSITYRADSAAARFRATLDESRRTRPPELAVDSSAHSVVRGVLHGRSRVSDDIPPWPLPSARLMFWSTGTQLRARAGGWFSADQRDAYDTLLTIWAPGYTPRVIRVGTPSTRIDATLDAISVVWPPEVRRRSEARVRIVGTVGDTSTRPVAGATVWMPGHSARTRTSTRGTFAVDAPPGTHLLVVDAPGFARQIVGVTVGSTGARDVMLWLLPREQSAAPVTDAALRALAARVSADALSSPRITRIARDAFASASTDRALADMPALRRLAPAAASATASALADPRCVVAVEGGAEEVLMPAAWVRPHDLELIEVEQVPSAPATCGAVRLRVWPRR